MTTLRVMAPELTGRNDLTAEVRTEVDGVLSATLNLTEDPASSGRFILAEFTDEETLCFVEIYSGAVLMRTGWLSPGSEVIVDAYPGLEDAIKLKTDLIGTASGLTSLLAAGVISPGALTGFPEQLVIGDSYSDSNGRSIEIPIVDEDGNALHTIGELAVADATATFKIRRADETDTSRIITGTAEITDPPGTGTPDGTPYVTIQLSSSETGKGLAQYKYCGILTLTWDSPGTAPNEVYSFHTETIKFIF